MKTTEIFAGKYKRIASSHHPFTEAGQQYIQDMVDYLYSVFVGEVANQRGTDTETVFKNMADGRVFIGQQAVSAGLVDGVATLDRPDRRPERGQTGSPAKTHAGAARPQRSVIQSIGAGAREPLTFEDNAMDPNNEYCRRSRKNTPISPSR